jgi:hypothetical protein
MTNNPDHHYLGTQSRVFHGLLGKLDNTDSTSQARTMLLTMRADFGQISDHLSIRRA